MIPLFLITGFLGSGKTTLLRKLAERHPERRWVFLVNDFGSADVDGERIAQVSRRVVAIAGGSIFCRCLVSEFIRVLREIAGGQPAWGGTPEAVIIEASGMADPRVMQQMLDETGLAQTYAIARIIALADPGTFHKLLKTLPAIKAQIAAADTVLISKADAHAPEVIAALREAVLALHPQAQVAECRWGEPDADLIAARRVPLVEGAYALCADPHYHRFTLAGALPRIETLRELVRKTSGQLFRMKGFVREEGALYSVDYSSSGFQAEPCPERPNAENMIVCIADGKTGVHIERIWTKACAAATLNP